MKFITYRENGKLVPAVLSPDGKSALSFEKANIPFESVFALVKSGESVSVSDFSQAVSLDTLELTSPLPRIDHDVICLGINYMAHAEESARYKKEAFERDRAYPVYFSKRVNLSVGDGESIKLHADVTERVDYEAEIAVVLGKTAKNVKKEDAYNYVFGYTVLNDVSARDVQTRHKQWYFGKSMDGFTSMGPCLVTADEINPEALYIRSYVNGEIRQNSNTSLMVFGIPHVIEELSAAMTLEAGTVISMGTPAGVGMGFDPPKFLKSGDTVTCEVEKIGSITNKFIN